MRRLCSQLDDFKYLIQNKIYQIVSDVNNQIQVTDDYDRLREIENVLIWDHFDKVMKILNDLLQPYGLTVDEDTVMDILQEAIVEII